MYPKVFAALRRCRAQVRAGLGAADAGLLLRHAGRRGGAASRSKRARRSWCGCRRSGETDEEGQVRVFFELNGQPRIMRVPNRAAAATRPARRKAEEGNATHVAAPMPGAISTVAVKPGQDVKAGDILLTMEAMKMETALSAPRDGKVAQFLSAGAAGRRQGFAGRNRLVVSRQRAFSGKKWRNRARPRRRWRYRSPGR